MSLKSVLNDHVTLPAKPFQEVDPCHQRLYGTGKCIRIDVIEELKSSECI